MERLILASASPQRKTLLEGLGLDFEVIPSSVNEATLVEADPVKRALILAQMKAVDISQKNPDAWVIGCDTLVVAPDSTLLEKPTDAETAREMIRRQRGGVSVVHSGISLRKGEQEWSDVSSSKVQFKELSDQEVEWWIATKLWQGRSGAFQIDGLGQLMIEHIEGDWTGIVGLPVFLLGEFLKRARVL